MKTYKKATMAMKIRKEVKATRSPSVLPASFPKRILLLTLSIYIINGCLSSSRSWSLRSSESDSVKQLQGQRTTSALIRKQAFFHKFTKQLKSFILSLHEFSHFDNFDTFYLLPSTEKLVPGGHYKIVHSRISAFSMRFYCSSATCVGGSIIINSYPEKFIQRFSNPPLDTSKDNFTLVFIPYEITPLRILLPIAAAVKEKNRGAFSIVWDILKTGTGQSKPNCSLFHNFPTLPASCDNKLKTSSHESRSHFAGHSAIKLLLPRTKRKQKDLRQRQRHMRKNHPKVILSHNSVVHDNHDIENEPPIITNERNVIRVGGPSGPGEARTRTTASIKLEFFRPLEIRLVCPPFSGAFVENNRCKCPKGKVNIMEKCSSEGDSEWEERKGIRTQTDIAPVVAPYRSKDKLANIVVKYICPEHTGALLVDKKCICPKGYFIRKRKCFMT